VHALLTAGIASGEVVPLPLNRFSRAQAGNAFRFMAAGAAPQPCCTYCHHHAG
jgi:fatty acid synthase